MPATGGAESIEELCQILLVDPMPESGCDEHFV